MIDLKDIDFTTIINWITVNPGIIFLILLVIVLLKGCALYRAARKDSAIWFWVLLIFNTLGILPLLYLIFSSKER